MVKRNNPIAVEVLAARPRVGPDQTEKILQELVQLIENTDEDNAGWLQKQQSFVKLRWGDKRPRQIPWKGAANVNLPLIDGIIRRSRPGFARLILDADPVVTFRAEEAQDVEAARKAEQFFHYLFREQINPAVTVVKLIDTIMSRGFAYTRECWDYKTRRTARVLDCKQFLEPLGGLEAVVQSGSAEATLSEALLAQYDLDPQNSEDAAILQATIRLILEGAQFVKLIYRTIVRDRPGWQVIDPINTICPQVADPEDAPFFTIIHEFSKDQMNEYARDGMFDKAQVKKVLEHKSTGTSAGSQKARESIADLVNRLRGNTTKMASARERTDKYIVWETMCYLDLDGTGEPQRYLFWYCASSKTPLAVLDYPYPLKSWNITFYPFSGEPVPNDNKGIAEMLKEFQKSANAFHNARINAADILLAPVIARRPSSGDLKRRINWRPGGEIEAAPNEVAVVQTDKSILPALIQEEQLQQRQAETYIGTYDATINNLQQGKERRTAAEIQAITSISNSVFGLDATLFVAAFGRSATKLWQLWEEFGPSETYFRVRNEEQPQRIRKEELPFNMDISATGTPSNTDRALMTQQYERMMQVLMNPIFLQSGQISLMPIVKAWVELVNYNMSKEVVLGREDSAAVQKILQANVALGGEPGAMI